MCHSASLLLLASLIAQVDAPPPGDDLRAAERALTDAGLTLLSNSYVLGGEIEADKTVTLIQQAQARRNQIVARLRPLQQASAAARSRRDYLMGQARGLRDVAFRNRAAGRIRDAEWYEIEAAKQAQAAAVAGQLMLEAERASAPLVRERDATTQEIRSRQETYNALVAEALRRYAVLATDPRIKAALRTLNRDRHPKLALGPVQSYQENVVKASLEILAELGLREEKGVYFLPVEAEFVERVAAADLLQREVGMHERRLKEIRSSRGPSGPAGTPAVTKVQSTPSPAEKARQITEFLSDRRAKLVERVPELREQADAIRARQLALAEDIEARDALAEVNKVRRGKARLGAKPGFQISLQKLEAIELALRDGGAP